MLAAVQEWREVADMADKQQGWQVLDGFPLSDEAVRLGAVTCTLLGRLKSFARRCLVTMHRAL